MSEKPLIKVEATLQFQRNLRKLAKKYFSIRSDLQPIIQKLQQGEILGDRIPNIGYEVFKLRIKNSDIQKGKSGGYRLIYYIKIPDKIILVTIYSKSQKADISVDEIKSIISDYQ